MQNKFVYHRFNKDPFHTHMKILHLIPSFSSVLEVGSSTGYLTSELLKKKCTVVSIEKDKEAVKIARKKLNNRIIMSEVESINKYISHHEKFDIILLADILEHLQRPKEVLQNLLKYLSDEGKVIVSVPNIANFAVRFNFFFLGKFEYQKYGILDQTHLHFFTKESIETIFRELGLKIEFFDVVSGFEVSSLYSKTVGRIVFRIWVFRYLEYLIAKLFPSLFSLELIYVLRK